MLVGYGTPCQDLGAAQSGRRSPEGDRSSRFWDRGDLFERLQGRFPYIDFRRFGVRDASTRGRVVEIMSKAVDLRPTEFDVALVSWVSRPRLG